MRDYNNGVTPRARRQNARQHPGKCEATPWKMWGNTPENARQHPGKCEASPQKCEASPRKMRGVTPRNARRHPKKCEASPPRNARRHLQEMRGVTSKKCEESPLKNARSHPQKMRGVTPNHCEESPPTTARSHPQPLRGVTPTTAKSHPNHCEESPQPPNPRFVNISSTYVYNNRNVFMRTTALKIWNFYKFKFFSKKFKVKFLLVSKSWNHLSSFNISPTLEIDTLMGRPSRILQHGNPKFWFFLSKKFKIDFCPYS